MTRRRWFLPETPDVLATLRDQIEVTREGMAALVRWAASNGADEHANAVRDAEHRADDEKRELRRQLREAFTTPLDPEDLYILSERLDVVMNDAKDAVRESEVMGIAPDDAVLKMARLVEDGVGHLSDAFDRLGRENHAQGSATDPADAAVKAQRQVERVYRKAMSALIDVEDLREVMGRREVYRRFSRLSDGVVSVAERVWYAVVKEG